MFFGNRPLYPKNPWANDVDCMRFPLFGHTSPNCGCKPRPPVRPNCGCDRNCAGDLGCTSAQRVCVANPANPSQSAVLWLDVDEWGNLIICVEKGKCECKKTRPPRHDICC